MSAKFFWFLPTNGDSRSIVGASHASSHHTIPDGYRAPTRRYLGRNRPCRRSAGLRRGADAHRHLVRGRLADRVGAARRDRTVEVPRRVPARPGAADARRAADRHACSGSPRAGCCSTSSPAATTPSSSRFGDWLAHDERYARTGEFLHIVNSIWTQESVDFTGKHYTVKDARVSEPPNPLPQIYFGGSSAAALPIAAEHVDVYLTWGEPPQAAAAKIAKVRELAGRVGATCGSASGCTPSAATPPRRRGRSPTNC